MGKRRKEWAIGDVFTIELDDHRYGVAQIIGREPVVLNSVTVGLFDEPWKGAVEAHAFAAARLFSALFTTRDLLDEGVWPVVGRREVAIPKSLFPYESTRASGWVGAKIIGSGMVVRFVNAYFGLSEWDCYRDPAYFDKLLLTPSKKPRVLRFGKP